MHIPELFRGHSSPVLEELSEMGRGGEVEVVAYGLDAFV